MKAWLLLIPLLLLAGCVGTEASQSKTELKGEVILYRSPTCGCCVGYASYLEENGYKVKIVEVADLDSIKRKYNIPKDLESCHTVDFGEFFVEGHVPLEFIEQFKQIEADGIALPGMPAGSPGMGGLKSEKFKVFVLKDGEVMKTLEG